MEQSAKTARQKLVDKADAHVDDWYLHESYCCPKHGCEYDEKWCPVVLGLTNEHNDYCEECERENERTTENPDKFALLAAYVSRTCHEEALMTSEYSYEHGMYDTDVIRVSDLNDTIEEIKRSPTLFADRGRKEGWWG
jgi:hypothetical protein